MAGSTLLTTPGYPTTFKFSPRTYGGRAIQTAKISDVDGSWSFGVPVNFTGGMTKGGAPVLAGNPFVVGVVAGHNGAQSTVLAGAVVGDAVVSAINLTGGTNVTSNFESTISVAGHIAQNAIDLSADTAIMVTLVHQS